MLANADGCFSDSTRTVRYLQELILDEAVQPHRGFSIDDSALVSLFVDRVSARIEAIRVLLRLFEVNGNAAGETQALLGHQALDALLPATFKSKLKASSGLKSKALPAVPLRYLGGTSKPICGVEPFSAAMRDRRHGEISFGKVASEKRHAAAATAAGGQASADAIR